MQRSLALGMASFFVLTGCSTLEDLRDTRVAEATLRTPNGSPVGSAQLIRAGDRIWLSASVSGLEEGKRGMHLHTTGKCAAPDFMSAGGHLNPTGRSHGSLSENGSHLGDLPNLQVSANRTANVQVDLSGTASDVLSKVFDADGTAIVIHAQADDYRTDPTGNAGARVACGVFEAL